MPINSFVAKAGMFVRYPNPVFNDGYGTDQIFRYVEDYQRLFAFEFTKKYKVVYATSIDIVDYYLRHYKTTPRTVHVSKTRTFYMTLGGHRGLLPIMEYWSHQRRSPGSLKFPQYTKCVKRQYFHIWRS